MVTIRLLKTRVNDYSLLLDSATIPNLETADDLNIITTTIGTLLKPYAETLKDSNIVSVLFDKSIKNWTITDIESIKVLLNSSGFDLLITQETNEDQEITPAQVKYILVDDSIKELGIIPLGQVRIKDKKEAVDQIAVIDVLHSILSEYNYFSKAKFVSNPMEDYFNQLFEARKLLGTLNNYAMNNLSMLLSRINKKLYVVSTN